nr:MAG TPA: hypothetical protein [Caudoviricetes sp.]
MSFIFGILGACAFAAGFCLVYVIFCEIFKRL